MLKYLILFVLFAQQVSAQIFVSSYDRQIPFYFCKGTPQFDHLNVEYSVANLSKPYKSIKIDSLILLGDTSIFKYHRNPNNPKDSFTLGFGLIANINYRPKKIGNDTLRVRAYYLGTYAEGRIIVHSAESPLIAFYGITTVLDTIFPGAYTGFSNEVLMTDTLHDEIGGLGQMDTPYTYGVDNRSIYVVSCGGETIDSFYTVGDFSEIQIKNIPSTPYKMSDSEILEMPIILIPKVVGSFPHYFVMHTTSGKYLVWSFEYKVFGDVNVKEEHASNVTSVLKLQPNPATNWCKILLETHQVEQTEISIFDAVGRMVMPIYNGIIPILSSDFSVDLSSLSNGTYYVVSKSNSTTRTAKLIIAR